MSINSVANTAVARRSDMEPIGTVPKGQGQIAKAAGAAGPVAAGKQAPSATADQVSTALNVVFGYIPIEIVTLYVAVLAALKQPALSAGVNWAVFFAFLVATPTIAWLAYAAKVKAAGKPLPVSLRVWPVWEMFAATIAYVGWTFALPDAPFAALSWYSAGLAAVAILVTSTVLGLLAPLFQTEIKVGRA